MFLSACAKVGLEALTPRLASANLASPAGRYSRAPTLIAPGAIVHATKQARGIEMATTRCIGSTTRLRSTWTGPAPTRPKPLLRMHRAEIGQHHHISGKYLAAYASEMAGERCTRRRRVRRCRVLSDGCGRGIGSNRKYRRARKSSLDLDRRVQEG